MVAIFLFSYTYLAWLSVIMDILICHMQDFLTYTCLSFVWTWDLWYIDIMAFKNAYLFAKWAQVHEDLCLLINVKRWRHLYFINIWCEMIKICVRNKLSAKLIVIISGKCRWHSNNFINIWCEIVEIHVINPVLHSNRTLVIFLHYSK